jgi:DNA (cytosine-5)-methyltransferase 1
MFENVPGLASAKFNGYRANLLKSLTTMGYQPEWRLLQAADFGVPQLRPRFVLVALQPSDAEHFAWPQFGGTTPTVGETLVDLMAENGWNSAEAWSLKARGIAPTIVGGSKKHGGPDLGPTRAKQQWRKLAVDGLGIADVAPPVDHPPDKPPRLTVRMVARIQSFPDAWEFTGGKTAAYRQVGNAFPPAVAKAVGLAIVAALQRRRIQSNCSIDSDPQMLLLDRDRGRRKSGY